VDGVEYPDGNPDWIEFSDMLDAKITITYSGITRNHEIEIVIDEI
jgi:hypothetical protein